LLLKSARDPIANRFEAAAEPWNASCLDSEPQVSGQRRPVALVRIRPEEKELADEILAALGEKFSIRDAGFRKPDDPYVSVDVGEGVSFQEAGRMVAAALDEIDRRWSEHLLIVEPKISAG
jgi:hypothetical protein